MFVVLLDGLLAVIKVVNFIKELFLQFWSRLQWLFINFWMTWLALFNINIHIITNLTFLFHYIFIMSILSNEVGHRIINKDEEYDFCYKCSVSFEHYPFESKCIRIELCKMQLLHQLSYEISASLCKVTIHMLPLV